MVKSLRALQLFLVIACLFPQLVFAQGSNLSKTPILPSSIVGKYMVYNSGAVTTFKQQNLYFITLTNEYYVYSRQHNRTDMTSRASYRNGVLTLSDKITPDEYRDLVSKNSTYKRCGLILKPKVQYRISAMQDYKTKMYYTDRWNVTQKTEACDVFNVRHHSKDNSCETWCVRPYKGYIEGLKNMRLYASQDAAMADSRSR